MESREITIEDRIIERSSMLRLLGYIKEMAEEMGIEPGDGERQIRMKAERYRNGWRKENAT